MLEKSGTSAVVKVGLRHAVQELGNYSRVWILEYGQKRLVFFFWLLTCLFGEVVHDSIAGKKYSSFSR